MSKYREIVCRVTEHILEDWALMMLDSPPLGADLFRADEPLFLTDIQFRGPVDGRCSIICHAPFMDTLSRNILGSDSELPEEQRRDALRELANVLTGNLLTECFGEDSVFDVILPRTRIVPREELSEHLNGFSVTYLADENPVSVSFRVFE